MVKKPRFRSNPEARTQRKVIDFLRLRGWYVRQTHGNAYSVGWPDLYCFHREHGTRWVDLKVLGQNRLTKAQCQVWPEMAAAGIGVWIMTSASEEEYGKLFLPANFSEYWRPSYDKYCRPVEEILDEMDENA